MGSDNGDWLKKYHAEHASYGGASHEFHARAQTWVATRDAEIARLKAEVETRRIERDNARETSDLRATRIERMERALAAGPAALRATYVDVIGENAAKAVEAAQAAAMKEEP